ncbi:virulence plasmid 65kDa B family protein [Mycobacterium kansasii]|uniref:Virulence plasmid 65kDa B family protein n=1 Tax=Mycobacterium kansasii TaxID=1768 RepID=A0A1V3XRC7_MYCKA|nr:virulence plasmid 65kDa B family protein [Mycobacterium kansasii]
MAQPLTEQSNAAAAPLALPKGGGAIRGIGEKFGANPVTGTGSLSIPIPASPGRDGFGPSLTLTYDSGSGNGPFGFGWTLRLASITRRTDRGLPRYRDAAESDVFILADTEDLVPVLTDAGTRFEDRASAPATSSIVTGPGWRACSRGSNGGLGAATAMCIGARFPETTC